MGTFGTYWARWAGRTPTFLEGTVNEERRPPYAAPMGRRAIHWPPSTMRIWPVVYREASLTRNKAASAISWILPKRPRGMALETLFSASGPGARRRTPSVSPMGPGAMPLARIPNEPHSLAQVRVKASMPALAEETWAWKGVPVYWSVAVMLMILALPCFFPAAERCGKHALVVLKVPSRSISTTVLKPL